MVYHDLFEYPLNEKELKRWTPSKKFSLKKSPEIEYKNGFYSLKGKENLISSRKKKESSSKTKFQIAQKAGEVLKIIPVVRGIFITGALAMYNADKDSDIDLMVITSKDCLWTTRILSYFLLYVSGIRFRRYFDQEEKDKICLNIWIDESNLSWDKNERNVYTAHEIAQAVPLVNKDKIYERFLWQNRWIRNYWPKAVSVHRTNNKQQRVFLCSVFYVVCCLFEPLARFFQFWYMRGKITREEVSSKKALFHPSDMSTTVLSRLKKYGAKEI